MSCMTIIRDADCITNEMHASTWQEIEHCLDVCCTTNGAHTDIY